MANANPGAVRNLNKFQGQRMIDLLFPAML